MTTRCYSSNPFSFYVVDYFYMAFSTYMLAILVNKYSHAIVKYTCMLSLSHATYVHTSHALIVYILLELIFTC